jgi:hypothetical protein
MHRLWNANTQRYLHLSGDRETENVSLSWLGYAHQAATLRERAKITGKPWPYVRRSRDMAPVDVPTFEQREAVR